jgi:hypothetical protein
MVMRRPNLPISVPGEPGRYAGWATLVGILGIAMMMIGIMLVAMAQAPAAPRRTVIGGFVMLASGFLLLVVAWLGRRPRA